MEAINKPSIRKSIISYMKNPLSLFLMLLVVLAAIITFSVLLFIIGFILFKGVPSIKPSLFAWQYNSQNVSLMPALITTLILTFFSLLIAVPFGLFTAIFLIEYSQKGNKIVGIIRITAETLSGIPSIVYGLFGMLFFVTFIGWGFSVIAGAMTLSIMILPLIIRTSEEALKSVPENYREASFGLGAGRLRTVFKIVIPAAIPGIVAGVILSIGRIVGETAALIYTAGTVAKIPENIFSSGRTLSLHLYILSSEGFNTDEAYATAVVLLVIVLLINTASAYIARRLMKG